MTSIHSTVFICAVLVLAPTRSPDIRFKVQMLDPGASEGAAVSDLNRDGRLDVVSGDSWYEAPTWRKHTFRELGFANNYIDALSDLALDVDGDGFPDIATVTWFSRKISWYRNPGASSGPWVETVINAGHNVEFAVLADMDNDGLAREIVAQENGIGQAWYEVRDKSWVRHVVSDRTWGHGIGAGDVKKDGRNDILTPRGWLEAPPDPRAPDWTRHPAWEAVNVEITPASGVQAARSPGAPPPVASLGFMHVLDVNGDGRNDVITAAGHDYGVFWFEQGTGDTWMKRMIDSAWSQGHASALVDLNGDGRLDFLTGKRFMAHNGADPGEREPLGVYWYEHRVAAGSAGGQPAAPAVEWIRHLVDYGGRMGAGLQIPAIDVDADGDIDIVCPGKSGLFLVENLTKGPLHPANGP